MSTNTLYMYKDQATRVVNPLERNIEKRENLRTFVYEDSVVLPARRKHSRNIFGKGGVVDKNGFFVKESGIYSRGGVINYPAKDADDYEVYFGGKYNFDKSTIITNKATAVYLGYIRNHWGHFLVDCSTRLWYLLTYGINDEYEYIFVVDEGRDFELIANISRFIELLGLNPQIIKYINTPTLYSKVIIPETSYETNSYYTEDYLTMFDKVAEESMESCNDNHSINRNRKYYFSRQQFDKAMRSECGEEILYSLFNDNGFEVVSPEKLTLDEQIRIIRESDEIACISGSLSHNMLFAKEGQTIIILNKTYVINIMQMDINYMRKLDVTYVDCYKAPVPISLGVGPFWIECSDCLGRWIKDNSLLPIKNELINEKAIVKRKRDFYEMFEERVYTNYRKLNFVNNWDSAHYYNVDSLDREALRQQRMTFCGRNIKYLFKRLHLIK